jgi:hypothetical protein
MSLGLAPIFGGPPIDGFSDSAGVRDTICGVARTQRLEPEP